MKEKMRRIFSFIRRNKVTTKMISFVLSLVLIFYVIPSSIYSEAAELFENDEAIKNDVSAIETEQSSNVFDGLKEGMTVTIYMRMKGSDTSYASEETSLEVVVGKMPVDEPTDDPIQDPTQDPEEGCGGSVVGSLIAMVSLASVVVFVSKKRKEDE